MRSTGFVVLSLAVLLLGSFAALGHEGTDHALEKCDLYLPPHDHAIGDGHAHTHDPATSLEAHKPCNQSGRDLPEAFFHEPQGAIPTYADALNMPAYMAIRILSDDAWADPIVIDGPALDIPGSGTPEDPYIIEGIHVQDVLKIQNTDACFIVRNNYFSAHDTGSNPLEPDMEMALLQLNYNGDCVHVYRNHVANTLVNMESERTGYATAGIFEENEFEFINIFRHFSGEFRHNTVGSQTGDNNPFPERSGILPHRIANFDGYYQARFHNNTFWGSVDFDFHGHYHGTGFYGKRNHYHGDDPDREMKHHNHEQRWNWVHFVDNVIDDADGYGLRFEDQNHRVDDRISGSENQEHLNEPHRHQTWLKIEGNEIRSGRIKIDMFNPERIEQLEPDGSETPFDPYTLDYEWRDYHPWHNDGWIDIVNNVITTNERDPAGTNSVEPVELRRSVFVWTTRQAEVNIEGNEVSWGALGWACTGLSTDPISCRYEVFGIDLRQIKDSHAAVVGNVFGSGYDCGVFARYLDAEVTWEITDNVFESGITDPVCQEAVENPPLLENNEGM